ncbi:FecR domain-containing protein [Luteimonas saliphila]|uniref:FecR domain-containing protein n=1 Tax=Luteimonas saliphila TaxID=2804919 RepID=UPI00192D50E0
MSRDPHAIAPQISQAAAEWFIIMREPVVSEADRAAFAAWLQASPVHVRAYLEVTRLWGDAAQLDPELPVAEDFELAAANVLPMREAVQPRKDAATASREPASAAPPRKTRRRPFAVAASIALMAGLVGAAIWWQFHQPPTYITDVGEQRVLTLEDGSIIRLNSRSEVKVRMLPTQRLIELVDGQALFEVAKDAQRPFIVRSGNVTTRAVGTQFDVYRKPTGTVVTVVEGQVEVRTEPAVRKADADIAGLALSVSVKAGEQVIVGRAGAVEQHRDANVNAATRWLQQELVFEEQPLSAVVEEFNRYQRIPIVLHDPALGELRVNAVFNTTGPEPLLRFVGRMEDVQVERTAREIRITRKQ